MRTTDRTTDQKDTSAEKQDASKGKQETSKETQTFTKESQAKAVSDALATAGRTAKAIKTREDVLQTKEQRIKDSETKAETKQKERDEAELEAAEGDKDERSRIKRKQALRIGELTLKQEREKFESEKAEQQVGIDAAKATQAEIKVFDIATKYGLNADILKDLSTDPEQLEKIAKAMSTKEGTGPDPQRTLGGGETTEQQRLDKLYPKMAKKS